jgi:hypothetical protein
MEFYVTVYKKMILILNKKFKKIILIWFFKLKIKEDYLKKKRQVKVTLISKKISLDFKTYWINRILNRK